MTKHKNNKIGIDALLRQRLAHYGLGKQYDASIVCSVANKVSDGRFDAISFREGILKVRVGSAARAHIVRMNQDSIISKINEELGEERVKRLRFEIEE